MKEIIDSKQDRGLNMASITQIKGKTIRYKATVRIKGHDTVCRTFSTFSQAVEWASIIEQSLSPGFKPNRRKPGRDKITRRQVGREGVV